jgi:hypothetical protein
MLILYIVDVFYASGLRLMLKAKISGSGLGP